MKKHRKKKINKETRLSLRNLQFTWLFSHGHSIKNNCGKAKPAAGNGRSQEGHTTGILLIVWEAFQHLHLKQARGWTPKGGSRHIPVQRESNKCLRRHQHTSNKRKTIKRMSSKLKTSVCKGHHPKSKKKTHRMGKNIWKSSICIKELHPEEYLQFNNKNTSNTKYKNGQMI